MEISKGTCLSLQSVPKKLPFRIFWQIYHTQFGFGGHQRREACSPPQVLGQNDKTFLKYQDIQWQYRQIAIKKSCLIIRREGFKIPSHRNFPFRGYPLPPSDLHRQHFPENFLQPKVIFGPHFCCRRFLNCNAAESQSIYLHLHSS